VQTVADRLALPDTSTAATGIEASVVATTTA
jgi:hypothetical protein